MSPEIKDNLPISVIMSVFNSERFIGKAIDSIVNQTFKDFEFIIINNASTDKTKEIISSYRDQRIILIENEKNLGQTKALNIGIRRSRGQFIARMDADDISIPQRLELQYKCLTENESIAVVGSWFEEIDETGRHIKYYRMPTEPLEIKCYLISPGELGYYCILHPAVTIRRNVLFEVGLYNEEYYPQDYDLWVRIIRRYKIANLDRFLIKHLISNEQQSNKFRSNIDADLKKIIISNIQYYLPSIEEGQLMSLLRMLQYRPQKSKEDGLKVLKIFNLFFKEYIDGAVGNTLVKKIKNKIELFYLFQLLKTNPVYSLRRLLKLICKNPDVLLDRKVYRKIIRAILNNP